MIVVSSTVLYRFLQCEQAFMKCRPTVEDKQFADVSMNIILLMSTQFY